MFINRKFMFYVNSLGKFSQNKNRVIKLNIFNLKKSMEQ